MFNKFAFKSHVFLFALIILFEENLVTATEFSFQPRLETGIIHYTFESEAVSGTVLPYPADFNSGFNIAQEAFEFSDRLTFIGTGGTFFVNRFFIDLSGQYAFDGDDSALIKSSSYWASHYDFENLYVETAYMARASYNRASFDRNDIALSLGYVLSKYFSVFAGYKWAKTEFTSTYVGPYTSVNYKLEDDFDPRSGCIIRGDYRFQFEYAGPFIGAIHGWDFSNNRLFKGMLTASLALAYLEGKVVLKDRKSVLAVRWTGDQGVDGEFLPIEGGGGVSRFDTRGNALGLTIGMGWNGVTAINDLSYFFNINGYRYEFEAKDNGQADINETALLFKAGFSYSF